MRAAAPGRSAAVLPRGAGAARRALRRLSPRLRRRLLVLLAAALALTALYLGWFRHSSLVAVERVEVSGLTTPEAERIEAALAAAARDMTTLHVRVEELEQAVAAFPVVRRVEASPDFPHRLTIRVVEHRPVATVSVAGEPLPVAADGTLLRGVPARAGLPRVEGAAALAGERLAAGRARTLVEVAGAAPRSLRPRIARLGQTARRGVVVALKDGPQLVFGSAARARAKWVAAAAVLADTSSEGASYIDLRIPERPTAGGLPVETIQPVAPAGQAPEEPPAAASQPGAQDARGAHAPPPSAPPAAGTAPSPVGEPAPADTGGAATP